MKPRLYIATNGLGVWYSDDLGESLIRMNSRAGMYSGSHIWALANDPSDFNMLWAGTNGGLFRLDQETMEWAHMPSPMDERHKITAIAFHPHNPDVILAGTQFAGMYRSEDHGRTWCFLDLGIPEICSNKNQSRFTQIIFDPIDPRLVWSGVELDYIWSSTDAGSTWRKITNGIATDDIHGLCVSGADGRRLFAATDRGLYTSDDDGESWEKRVVNSRSEYMRAVVSRADQKGVLFLTNGDGPPGSWGRLMRSRDNGGHWEEVALPGEVDSTMWSVATHPRDPDLLFASSCLGQIYRSADGGEHWIAIKRRLGEIRHVIWLPR
jgi:photosystem II stability/assembly factor-like uncharacterized protein